MSRMKAAATQAAINDVRRDAYILINAITAQMTQIQNPITAVNTSTFMGVMSQVQACGVESLFKAMSDVVASTIFSSRPYRGKFQIMRVMRERWGGIIRKVVYLSVQAEPTTSYNTADGTPLENGKSVDMYKINNPGVVQLTLYKQCSLQVSVTRFRHQMNTALSNEREFMAFWDAFMLEVDNSIETMNEARRRMVALNAIAGSYALGEYVDLVAAFNGRYGTTYTRAELLGAHLKEFTLFAAVTIKQYSNSFTDRSNAFQTIITLLESTGKHILHHTPKPRQRLLMYGPAIVEQEGIVMPELFGPGYIPRMTHETVNFWQHPGADASQIVVKPIVLDPDTGEGKEMDEQTIPYVYAYLYDEEHMGTVDFFESAEVTPYNVAGKYWNIFYNWIFGGWNDFTEKHLLFVLGDGGPEPEPEPEPDTPPEEE